MENYIELFWKLKWIEFKFSLIIIGIVAVGFVLYYIYLLIKQRRENG